MPLESPFLVYGVISLNGTPYEGAVVSVQDTTLGSAVLTGLSDENGQYIIDIQSIATDGDSITVWCDLGSLTDDFILNVAGAMEMIDLSYTITQYFLLTQTPVSKTLLLYPDGAYHSCCTAVGALYNYDCVNDTYDLPDDDSTYVWHNRSTSCTDMYTLPNHTSETGTINYVRIYARAKSHLYQQASTGSYRILAYHSGATARSSDIDITTDYNTYSLLLTSTPSGGAWNWNAIDDLRIGFDCTSPISTGAYNSVFRPNSAGAINQLIRFTDYNYDGAGTVNNYTYINDVNPGDESTLLRGLAYQDYKDAYAIPNHTVENGSINHVSVYFRAKEQFSTVNGYGMPLLYMSAAYYYGTNYSITNTWKDYSYKWTTSPTDSVTPFTWTDIDNMQIGIRCNLAGYSLETYFMQVYAIVNYNGVAYPEVRTTQMYALVNYTPDTGVCRLNQPVRYNISNNRKVCVVQPERGDRVVYDLCRDNKTLTLEGIEYDTDVSTATIRLACVKEQKDNGEYITISGIGDAKVDTTWLITDFTYSRNERNQRIWNWVITAEKYESG